METAAALMIAPILLIAAYCDLRFLRIPDLASLALVAIFVFTAALSVPDDILYRLAIAAAVFVAGFLAFAARLVGGGDVKLLSAVMLFIPSGALVLFANVFSVSLLIGVALVVALRARRLSGAGRWKALSEPKAFPMGISIALAGLIFPIVNSGLAQ